MRCKCNCQVMVGNHIKGKADIELSEDLKTIAKIRCPKCGKEIKLNK